MSLQSRIDYSIALLRKAELLALKMHPDGFHLAFSGGKDSQVLYHLTGWLARNTSNKSQTDEHGLTLHGNTQLWVYVKNSDFDVIASIHDKPELITNEI